MLCASCVRALVACGGAVAAGVGFMWGYWASQIVEGLGGSDPPPFPFPFPPTPTRAFTLCFCLPQLSVFLSSLLKYRTYGNLLLLRYVLRVCVRSLYRRICTRRPI